jgi:proprotein convertase subtilisin/kexin type 2
MNNRLVWTVILCAGITACNSGSSTTAPGTPPPAAPAPTPAPIPVVIPPAPTAPGNVSALARDGYVLLNVQPVQGATSYNIYWSNVIGVTKTSGTLIHVTTTSYRQSGLTNGQLYYYVVTAVGAGGESTESTQVNATPRAVVAINDPLFADQWHLRNRGQSGANGVTGKADEDINVQQAWISYKGTGVRIAVVDDGLEIAHEDLASNVVAGQSYNYVTSTTDPTNLSTDIESGHGTSVAGIATATDSNSLGGSGVAPRASLVGYNLLQNFTLGNIVNSMIRNAKDVGVSSNSWGAPDGLGLYFPSPSLWTASIDTGLAAGRSGKGTIYVWAAGNGRGGSAACPFCSDDSNYDGQANYHGVVAVAAVNDQGEQSSYSESGANLWVSAPGGEFCSSHAITTTDRTGAVGINATGLNDYSSSALNYTKCMNGTSAATPVVAGVVALILEANPNLGWRDVKSILAQTARKNNPLDNDWTLTGGITKYHFNHKYGFGVVDAGAAVAAAQSWVNVGPELSYTTPLSSPSLAIPENNVSGVSNTINVAGSGINSIEFVEITFTTDHTYIGDLNIFLRSPSGTVSRLAASHLCENASACNAYSGWVFGSARHLGESADGNWRLGVSDGAIADVGTFSSWKLKFYGH